VKVESRGLGLAKEGVGRIGIERLRAWGRERRENMERMENMRRYRERERGWRD
jgi:hypothetical protein